MTEPSLAELTRRLEDRSLNAFCKKAGVSRQDFERWALELATRDVAASGDAGVAFLGAEYGLHDDHPVLTSTDAIGYGRSLMTIRRRHLIEDLQRVMPRLPLNWPYLDRLAAILGIGSHGHASAGDLAELLERVPFVLSFEFGFNAHLSFDRLLPVPYVMVHEGLISGVEGFVDLMLSGAIEVEGKRGNLDVAMRSISLCRQLGRDESFQAALADSVEMLLGKRLYIALSDRHSLRAAGDFATFACNSVLLGARSFVWLHEYGHLLMGHLDQPLSHKLEFEADEFAWRVLLSRYAAIGDGFVLLDLIGGVLTLTALRIIAIANNQPPSKTHPEPGLRVGRILGPEGGNEMQQLVQDFAQLVKALCDSFLMKAFGVGI